MNELTYDEMVALMWTVSYAALKSDSLLSRSGSRVVWKDLFEKLGEIAKGVKEKSSESLS